MSEYPNNSNRNREEKKEKKIEKVVTKGKVKTKKQSEFKKIAGNMISEEAKSIKDYAIYDVVIPVIKDTISQLIKGSIDMLFYGEVRNNRNNSYYRGVNASRVSYSDYYDNRRDRDIRERRERELTVSYNNLTFDYREDAEEVLNRMDELVEQYGVVTVADMFELAGVTGNGYTDQNYGWTSTRAASVERTRYGEYIIKIGRPCNIR